jgi:hypothetical protein
VSKVSASGVPKFGTSALFRRLIASSVVVAFICALAVQAALARQTPNAAAGPCQANASGHRWLVAPRGLSCSTGKKVVEKLAGKKVPAGGFFAGTYEGMKCLSTTRPGSKPKYIGCAAKNGSKSLVAFQQ